MKNLNGVKENHNQLNPKKTEFGINFETISKSEKNKIITGNYTVTLYHGSKSGINGIIRPISRDKCDFGKGFYMGTERMQPLTLICNYVGAKLYTLSLNMTGLRILDIEVGIDWALFIAFNRGKIEAIKDSFLYERYKNMSVNYDIVIGYIANDRMFVVLDRFFNGEITDVALTNSLSALKLGKQYVALTDKACSQISIVNEQSLNENERKILKMESEQNRLSGIAMANEICLKYRREGRFFDEILKEGEQYGKS